MERRSTRLTARPAKLAGSPDDDMQLDDSEYEQPPIAESSMCGKKRKSHEDKDRKVGLPVKKFRGKRGLLRHLVEMPLDVLFVIFGHLNPLDLLQLVRTTKDLRAILMNRSSTSVWKHARSHFSGLPDCPNDLSEPQYAELLFGKSCTFCQRNLSTNTVIWTSRVRCCNKCVSIEFSSLAYSTGIPTALLEYIRFSTWVKIGRRSSRQQTLYFSQLCRLLGEEHRALKTASERSDWLVQKIEERKAIEAHAKLCEQWVISMQNAQEMEKTALIDQRKAIIVERVKTLGWSDELSKMSSCDRSLQTDPYIEKICHKDITGRVFIPLDSFINTFMEAVKARRLLKEHTVIHERRLPILRRIYVTCVSTYPINPIIPSCCDVFLDPFVQDLIISPPLSATFTDEDLVTVETTFPDIVLRWRKKVEEQLLNMITQVCGTQNISESVFKLATTIFTCESCPDDLLTYPRVLVHHCATKRHYHEDLASRLLGCSPWNSGKRITFEARKLVVLTEAIKLCGLDPQSATGEDIDKQKPIFECLVCNDARKGRCTLSWPGLFVHLQRPHLREDWNDLKIKLLEEEDAAKVRDRMAETLSHKRAQMQFSGFYCVHCRLVGDALTMTQHVKRHHKIPEPTDEDIVPVLDYKHFQGEHWLWPPRPVDDTNVTIV